MRKAYGFDDVSLTPSSTTIDIQDVDISWEISGIKLKIPIIAAAMDAVVDPNFAIEMSKAGGFGVLNLEGLYTRYDNPMESIQSILNSPVDKVTGIIQEIYKKPIQDDLVYRCIKKIKDENSITAVSSTPVYAEKFRDIIKELDIDLFVIQSTVTSPHHYSSRSKAFDFQAFFKSIDCPVLVGNCVTYESAFKLLEFGASGLLVGIGPGAACTTRQVLGVGVPQITATMDVAEARDQYYKKTGKYLPIITDGGILSGGDLAKSIASGADSVMLGSLLSMSKEAPGKGYHWGMATSNHLLPRGTRIYLGKPENLSTILFGPSQKNDGLYNLLGALKMSMATCGYKNIKEMQSAQIIIAPSIKYEGKYYQHIQRN